MAYFRDFPRVFYAFGNESERTYVQDISIFADIVDQVKDVTTIYQDYFIQENERPDQVSFKLYDNPNYHWTITLMNDKLRESGWPLSNSDIIAKTQKDHPYTTITTRTTLYDRFKVGQTISGNVSGATATIDHRHLDLGQLVIKNVIGTFVNGELVSSINASGVTETITIQSTGPEYLSASYYIDGDGVITDIDPTVGPGALLTEVTYLDRYIAQNEELKQIRVIKPTVIQQIVTAQKESINL